MRMARPRARERLPPHHPLGHAELLADASHLVLEEEPQRLDELHRHVIRQAADVVMRLDRLGDAVGPPGLDHVGVQGPLHEPRRVADGTRLILEDANELLPDDLALGLRVGDAREPGKEALLRLHMHERDVEDAVERLDHLLGLTLAEQAVVDEHARQLVADRLVDEQRCNGRVDAARQCAQDALLADLRANALDLLLDHSSRRPHRSRRRRSRTGSSSGCPGRNGVWTTSGWN